MSSTIPEPAVVWEDNFVSNDARVLRTSRGEVVHLQMKSTLGQWTTVQRYDNYKGHNIRRYGPFKIPGKALYAFLDCVMSSTELNDE